MPPLIQLGSYFVVIVAHLLAEVSRTRVNHNPKIALLILLQLYEMVAATQCAHLMEDGLASAFYNFQTVDVIAHGQVFLVLRLLVVVHSERYALPDSTHNLLAQHLRRYVGYLPVCFNSTHAATDIHPYGVGYDSILTGQHTADRHSNAGMHVGHDGQVMEKEGQCGQVLDLAHGSLLHAVRPYHHRTVVDHLNFHCLFFFNSYTFL